MSSFLIFFAEFATLSSMSFGLLQFIFKLWCKFCFLLQRFQFSLFDFNFQRVLYLFFFSKYCSRCSVDIIVHSCWHWRGFLCISQQGGKLKPGESVTEVKVRLYDIATVAPRDVFSCKRSYVFYDQQYVVIGPKL